MSDVFVGLLLVSTYSRLPNSIIPPSSQPGSECIGPYLAKAYILMTSTCTLLQT
jgi:hypothetical protein